MSIGKDKRELTEEQLEKVAGGRHITRNASSSTAQRSSSSASLKPHPPVVHLRSSSTTTANY